MPHVAPAMDSPSAVPICVSTIPMPGDALVVFCYTAALGGMSASRLALLPGGVMPGGVMPGGLCLGGYAWGVMPGGVW